MMAGSMQEIVGALESIAPLRLAGDWDNVGLLVEPTTPRASRRVLLTIDLTEPVLAEAIEAGCDGVIAYHPTIFQPLRRLTQAETTSRIPVRAIEAGLWIYSPHTALDATSGGVNDWLADALEPESREAIEPVEGEDGCVGQGRRLQLSRAWSLDDVVATIKGHLGLAHVQVAVAPGHREGPAIRTAALCAGAGGSVIAGEAVDLWWTGEMRHHDVLTAVARGTSVVLCHHTNTERGYLEVLRDRLSREVAVTEFVCSQSDQDPLRVT